MRLLADQDIYAVTVRLLRQVGHDAVTAAEMGQSRTTDSELLAVAQREDRILITRDRDFGSLVFLQHLGAGVIYLRTSSLNLNAVHAELERVLGLYSEEDLHGAFVVVEAGRHRFRRLAR
ncbi:MAG: hypothetical protein AMK72_04890 [Planctomycetes bacterium SM23_25]|nr:MAG: hypothetical protein AMS14_04050 [Planctomycetes bacterium DG_20]KPK49292.1 MAG: hypothetical protein AMK72_04890 [Planctomycetes bacterium SM23_25]